jgi:ketosteroid isomerase-like protein
MNPHYDQYARQVFDAIDTQDIPRFLTYLTPDASFTFGNFPTVEGATAIAEFCRQFYQSIHALRHTLLHVWHDGDAVIVHEDVTYTRKDMSTVTLPCVTLFRMNDNRIRDYRVFMDVGPVYAPPASA